MKKVGIRYLFLAFLLLFFALPVAAEQTPEGAAVEKELADWQGSIPSEVADLLPASFFASDPAEMEQGVREAGAPAAIFAAVGRFCGLALQENLRLLAGICGLLLIGALFHALAKAGNGGEGTGNVLSLCTTAALAVGLFTLQRSRFSAISDYFAVMQGVCAGMIPLMGALYAMGGNVGAAVANHGVLAAFLSLLETAAAGTVLPVAGVCLCLALCDALSPKVNLRPLCGLIKRTYTLVFSFSMLLLCGVLGIQTTLAKGSDTLALRTARFAAGSFLPVVGGSVSEALRTVSGSVQYLRSVTGTAGILVLLFAFLPVFLSVLISRITFLLGGTAAKMLGCEGEEKLLSELAGVYGYFLAVIASLFVMAVFSLTLFALCATAGG